MIWSKEETFPRHKLSELQTERLKETVARVYANVPFYQRKFAELGITPEDITSIDDIAKLPFTKSKICATTTLLGFLRSKRCGRACSQQ